MTARLLGLPVAFAALFVASGCAEPAPVETPTPADPPKTEAQANFPVAPAPRAKRDAKPKTTAELLVGKWQLVNAAIVKVDPKAERSFEFTAEGTFVIRMRDVWDGVRDKSGTYVLSEGVIRLTSRGETWEVTVTAISESELTIVAGPPTDLQVNVFKHIEKK